MSENKRWQFRTQNKDQIITMSATPIFSELMKHVGEMAAELNRRVANHEEHKIFDICPNETLIRMKFVISRILKNRKLAERGLPPLTEDEEEHD